MFGWFRQKRDTKDDLLSETGFLALHEQLCKLPPAMRVKVSYGVAFTWRQFALRFTSINHFRQQSLTTQREFYQSIGQLQKSLAAKDPTVGAGALLTMMYLAAVIERGEASMINRIADKLEPFNLEGSEFLAREIELDRTMIHCAGNVTLRHQESKTVIQPSEVSEIIRSTCVKRGLVPSAHEEKLIEAGVLRLAGADIINSMLRRWPKEGDVDISDEDIRLAKIELEHRVAEHTKSLIHAKLIRNALNSPNVNGSKN